jgi:hypothetical protein
MTVKRLLRCTIVPVALCAFLMLPGTGRASFVYITNPSGLTTEMLFNSAAQHNVNSFVGSVGAQSGGIPVTVTAGQAMDVTIDTGAGFATIKPSSSSPSPLTSLTFTPTDDTLFNDFVTNGQLQGAGNTPETFSISVTDQNGVVWSLAPITIHANTNGSFPFDIGVVSNDGGTIKSVTFSAPDGIKESKQTEFSLAPGASSPAVPEPSTMALVLSGLVSAGIAGLRRLRRPQAATV